MVRFFVGSLNGLFSGVLALVAFTVLALVLFTLVVAATLGFFAFVVALVAHDEFDAAQDEVLFLIVAEVGEVFPSGLHLLALGLHFGAGGFAFSPLLLGHFRHFVLALVTGGFAFSLVGFHLGVHLGEQIESFLVQFGLGGIVHVVPVGVFGLQGAEGAVMLFGDSLLLRFSGFLLFGSVVASDHEEASKTHH